MFVICKNMQTANGVHGSFMQLLERDPPGPRRKRFKKLEASLDIVCFIFSLESQVEWWVNVLRRRVWWWTWTRAPQQIYAEINTAGLNTVGRFWDIVGKFNEVQCANAHSSTVKLSNSRLNGRFVASTVDQFQFFSLKNRLTSSNRINVHARQAFVSKWDSPSRASTSKCVSPSSTSGDIGPPTIDF
jgi:hypothetical protein